MPISSARPEPVDIDQFFDMFNTKTRTAIRQNEAGFGNALAGRGPQLNEAFGVAAAARGQWRTGAAEPGRPAAPISAASGERLRISRRRWPRSPTQMQASSSPSIETFGAFARVSRPYIQETISKSPSTLDTANADLPVLRPFLHDSQRFFTALEARGQGACRNLADDRRCPSRRRSGSERVAGLLRPARADGGSTA